jgi:hypothetical protein
MIHRRAVPSVIPTVVSSLAGFALAVAAAASEVPPFPSPRAVELEAALSAAPAALREGATLWATGPRGFERVREGGNGVTCLVEHEPGGGWAPICWDREGTSTILPVALERERLRLAGKDAAAIDAEIAAGFAAGRFRAPERTGISWMLSDSNWVFDGERVIHFHPHLMIYAPYVTNADVAGDPRDPARPWVLAEGSPHAYLIVTPATPANAAGESHAGHP